MSTRRAKSASLCLLVGIVSALAASSAVWPDDGLRGQGGENSTQPSPGAEADEGVAWDDPSREPPVADGGYDRHAHLGDTIQLDGSRSFDPDGDAIVEYVWAVDAAPPGSVAVISDPAAVNPTFMPDLIGDYVLALSVSDGVTWSDWDLVQVKIGVLYLYGEDPDIQITETQLTSDPVPQFDPVISGTNVVYVEYSGGRYKLYLISEGGLPVPLIEGARNQYEPDIDGTTVVYTDDATGFISRNVWWYDWVSGEHFQITTNPFSDVAPAISGNNVVYDGYESGSHEIFWYSHDTGVITPLTATPSNEGVPDINNNLVVWLHSSGASYDIKGRDLSGGEFDVATSDEDEESPSVSGYRVSYGMNWDIYVYDHLSGRTVQVTDSTSSQGGIITGDYLYYSRRLAGVHQIMVHDLVTANTWQLTPGPDYSGLSDADGNRAVFTRFLPPGNTSMIYLVEFSLPTGADLGVTDCWGPAQQDAGQTIEVEWTVANLGGEVIDIDWTDTVYLSPDEAIGDDIVLADFDFTESLAPQESYDRVETLLVPDDLAGDYQLIVKTDSSNAVEEPAGEDNNALICGPITIFDVLPPETEFTAGPEDGSFINVTEATFEWIGADNGTPAEDLLYSYCLALSGEDCDPSPGPFVSDVSAYFDSLSETESPYLFQVVAQDAAGHIDPTPASASFSVDVTPPEILSHDPQDPVGHEVCEVTLTFTEPVLGFTADDVTLIGPAGTIAVFSVEPTGQVNEYAFSFSCQAEMGVYGFVVGPDITDRAGNYLTEAYSADFEIAYPDLTPVELDIPPQGLSGSLITVEWLVENAGLGTGIGPWTDAVYLSEDDQWGEDDLRAEFEFSETLAPGETYRRVQNVSLPGFIEGDYWMIVVIDDADEVFEINEDADNRLVSAAPIHIASTPYPDLEVTALDVPAEAWDGQDVVVCWTVTNQGDGPTTVPTWTDRVYLSLTVAVDHTSYRVNDYENTSSLQPGESYEQCQTITMRVPLPDCYFFIVQTDVYNRMFEYRPGLNAEDNNISVADACTDVSIPPPSDLIVNTVVAPLISLSGEDITVSWQVENNADAPTPTNYWWDGVYLSLDETLDDEDQRFCGVEHNGYLNPGETYLVEESCRLPRWIEGDYYVIVKTDVWNHVPEQELDENNTNYDPSPIEITVAPPPDLQVTTLDVFESESGCLRYYWEVTNVGGDYACPGPSSGWQDAMYWSQDEFLETTEDNILIGRPEDFEYPHDYCLAPGESYFHQTGYQTGGIFCINPPACAEGDYHLFAVCDVADDVEEYYEEFENNNHAFVVWPTTREAPDLAVSDVSGPATAGSAQSISISWTVSNEGTAPWEPGHWDKDCVYLSPDQQLDPETRISLGCRSFSGVLEPGESYTVEAYSIPLPGGFEGDYYVFVVADTNWGGRRECELIDNNLDYDPGGLSVYFAEADLVVDWVDAPADGGSGTTIDLTYRVSNVGAEWTPTGNWYDRAYLSTDPHLDPTVDLPLESFSHLGVLGPGESYEAEVTVTLPEGISTPRYVITCADDGDYVSEPEHEDNNCTASELMTVSPINPDLAVTSVTAPVEGQTGDVLLVTWQVENVGERATTGSAWLDAVYISADQVLDEQDLLLRTRAHQGRLELGETYTAESLVTLEAPETGSFFILVQTDVEDEVLESGTGVNNVNYDPAGIQVTCLGPDLAVADVVTPPVGAAGLPMTVTWTVANDGEGTARGEDWVDVLYLSDDDVLNPDTDLVLGTYARNHALFAGETYLREAVVELPDGIGGTYYIFVNADADDMVLECGREDNNLSQPPATVSIGLTEVDLQVTSITMPAEIYAGQEVTIEWSVINAGTSATPEDRWTDRVYLSLDSFFDPGLDPVLGFVQRTEPLPAGVSYHTGGVFEVPVEIVPGEYYAFVWTDENEEVYEHGAEENNLNVSADRVPLYEPLTVDLVVTEVVGPTTAIPGTDATFTWTVLNQGVNSAVGRWYDSVYLSADDTWDVGDALVATVRRLGPVGPSESYAQTRTLQVPGVDPVPHYVIVRTDIRDHIPEDAGELNNTGVSVASTDILITELELGVPFESAFGDVREAYYQVTVPADQTLRVSFDGHYEHVFTELYIKYGALPVRGADYDDAHDVPFSVDQQVIIPTTQAGTYYLLAYLQTPWTSGPARPYTILAESIPFGIDELDPDAGSNAAWTTVEITGARFTEDTEFSLITPDQQQIWPTAVYPHNSARAFATFDLREQAFGSSDAQATTPLGDADTAVGAFEILEGGGGRLAYDLVAPSSVRDFRPFGIRIDYANVGVADMPAPMLEVRTSIPLQASAHPDGPFHTTPIRVMGVNHEGPAGILPSGVEGSLPIYFLGTEEGEIDIGVAWLTGVEAVDWEAEGERYRPEDISDASWDDVWPRVQEHLGATYGEFEEQMARLATRLWMQDQLVWDLYDLMAREIELAFDFYPSVIAGRVFYGQDGDPMPGETLWARSEEGRFITLATTDPEGNYEFHLPADTYDLYIEGYIFEPTVQVEVLPDVELRGLDLFAVPIPEQDELPEPRPLDIPDHQPSIVRDGNGNVQMAFIHGSEPWHAIFDGSEWTVTGPVQESAGNTPSASTDPRITRGAGVDDPAAVTIAWQEDYGNESELFYVGGQPQAGGEGFRWTVPVQLTDDGYNDQAPTIAVTDDGRILVTWLKQDQSIADDTDLYYAVETLSGPAWPPPRRSGSGTLASGVPTADADALMPLEDPAFDFGGGVGSRGSQNCAGFGYQKTVSVPGPFPVGGDYGAGASFQICGALDTNKCEWAGSAALAGQLYCGAISGSATGTAKGVWSVRKDPEPCDWIFNQAQAGVAGQVNAKIPMGPIPLPPPFVGFIPGSMWGVNVQAGLPSTSFTWQGPNWQLMPSAFDISVLVGGGPYGEIVVPVPFFGDVKAELSGLMTVQVTVKYPPPAAAAQGCLTVQAKASAGPLSVTISHQWCVSTPSARPELVFSDGALVVQERTPVDGGELLATIVVEVIPHIGTGGIYPGNPVLTDVSGDLWNDYAASLAVLADGSIQAAWAKDSSDFTSAIGSSLLLASYDGAAWSAPQVLADATDFNSSVQLAVDAGGTATAIWLKGSGAGLSLDSDPEEILDAMMATDVVFSRKNGLDWTEPQAIAELEGTDSAPALAADDTGQLLAAWMHAEEDGVDQTVYASIWDGETWSAAQPVSQMAGSGDVQAEFLLGTPMVVWSADADGDISTTPTDQRIFFSLFDGAAWSQPTMVPTQPERDDPDQETGAPRSGGLFSLPPIPQECCWECKTDADCIQQYPSPTGMPTCLDADCVAHECVYTPLDWVCDDHVFCNGEEKCDPPNSGGNPDGCVVGEPPCDPSLCDEPQQRCRECNVDADCDDGYSCSDETCVNGACHVVLDHAVCDNGLFCDGTETCWPDYAGGNATGCVDGSNPCPPAAPCTEGPSGPICSCQTDADCEDYILCTDDSCVGQACQNTPDDADCNDGSFCPGPGECRGLGSPGVARGCVHPNPPCGTDGCKEATQECFEIECLVNEDCDDDDICTSDSCRSDLTCENRSCDDGNPCTTDSCDASSGCTHDPASCPGENDPCKNVLCDVFSGCLSFPVPCANVPIIRPRDPNEKVGPAGYGPEGWVPERNEMFYTIYFENVPDATAPAQMVTIVDQLSPDLDWSSFHVGDIGFGDVHVVAPEDRSFFQADIDLIDEMGLIVRIIANLDYSTGQAQWRLISLDPETGDLPLDADAGFLPPNDPETGDGEGFVTFRIKPATNVETGTQIVNGATIIFDDLESIDTNEVLNTVDADPPTSMIDALPDESPLAVTLLFSGEDPPGGSGFASYDIYASRDGEPFVLWLSTTEDEVEFISPVGGATWMFYSLGRDHAGNTEAPPEFPDAVTTMEVQIPEAVTFVGTTAVTVRIDQIEPVNADYVEHALFEETTALYVGPDERLQTEPFWQPLTDWSGTVVRALSPLHRYDFRAQARSDAGVETDFGPHGYAVTSIPGDVNGDREVDAVDLDLLRASLGTQYGEDGFNPAADLDGDGVVTYIDLGLLRRALDE